MQKEHLHWFRQWFQASPDYVILFSAAWEIIWQNRECPMLPQDSDYRRCLGLDEVRIPKRGTYTLCHAGELYSFRLDIPENQPEQLFLIRISEKSCQHIGWSDAAWRSEAENHSAALRSQVFGITNAAASLYSLVEETGDQFPQLQDEQLAQLNIICGNCCQLTRAAILWTEQARYHEMEAIFSRPLFLDRELSNFVESCRKILGKAVRINLETASFLCIRVNRQRMTQALLCMLIQLHRDHPEMNLLHLSAEQQENSVVLTVSASSSGKDDMPSRHAVFQPMFSTSLLSMEESILRLFCETYGVVMLNSHAENRVVYTLRFPVCDDMTGLSLESSQTMFRDEAFSIYQIMLADISEYRFY